jgi:hypothetical protein
MIWAFAWPIGQSIGTKGAGHNNLAISNADPSRLTALLVGSIERLFALLAPCQARASKPELARLLWPEP